MLQQLWIRLVRLTLSFGLFGFFFSAGTVFFSHNNSAGTVFSTKFSQANGAMVQKEEKFSIF